MTGGPLDVDPQLIVVLDLAHPFACLALRPTIEFVRASGVEADWLPLATPPLKPPSEPGPDDDRGVLHRRARARAIAREIETYAAAQGLLIRDYYVPRNVEVAHAGWLWMRDHHPDRLVPFLETLFRSHWVETRVDPDLRQTAAWIASHGGDPDGFLAWSEVDGRSVAAAVEDRVRALGVDQAPAYVLGEEVFFGRQHLPMLARMLGDRAR